MQAEIIIKKLTMTNIEDYELLTKHGDDGKLCYCSFWHQKWASMEEYKKVQNENPERLKNCVIDRVQSGFHVGVIAYINDTPCAWVSVGPLTDFFWAWRRVAEVGETAKNTAAILCFTVAPEFRGQHMQERVLKELANYGQKVGWTTIEAYPFSDEAHQKHGDALKWSGLLKSYQRSGFDYVKDHWLSSADLQRFLYSLKLEEA